MSVHSIAGPRGSFSLWASGRRALQYSTHPPLPSSSWALVPCLGFASMHVEPRFAGTSQLARSVRGRPLLRKWEALRARATGRRGFPVAWVSRCAGVALSTPIWPNGPVIRLSPITFTLRFDVCTYVSVTLPHDFRCRPLSLPARPLSAALEGSSWLPHSPLPLPTQAYHSPRASTLGEREAGLGAGRASVWGLASTQGVLSALPRSYC